MPAFLWKKHITNFSRLHFDSLHRPDRFFIIGPEKGYIQAVCLLDLIKSQEVLE